MGERWENTTAADVALAYEAFVGLGASAELEASVASLRTAFQERTGNFGPEDTWFEPRVRAFWDDALTFRSPRSPRSFADHAAERIGTAEAASFARSLARAHRGFFLTEEVDDLGALLVDVWSGAELRIRHLDDTQALTLEHAEGAIDGRVIASGMSLYLLPGAYHHPADTLEPAIGVLAGARERGLKAAQALDALLRMELVFRASSRVKAAFAYRLDGLKTL